jgi:hypothetical protein
MSAACTQEDANEAFRRYEASERGGGLGKRVGDICRCGSPDHIFMQQYEDPKRPWGTTFLVFAGRKDATALRLGFENTWNAKMMGAPVEDAHGNAFTAENAIQECARCIMYAQWGKGHWLIPKPGYRNPSYWLGNLAMMPHFYRDPSRTRRYFLQAGIVVTIKGQEPAASLIEGCVEALKRGKAFYERFLGSVPPSYGFCGSSAKGGKSTFHWRLYKHQLSFDCSAYRGKPQELAAAVLKEVRETAKRLGGFGEPLKSSLEDGEVEPPFYDALSITNFLDHGAHEISSEEGRAALEKMEVFKEAEQRLASAGPTPVSKERVHQYFSDKLTHVGGSGGSYHGRALPEEFLAFIPSARGLPLAAGIHAGAGNVDHRLAIVPPRPTINWGAGFLTQDIVRCFELPFSTVATFFRGVLYPLGVPYRYQHLGYRHEEGGDETKGKHCICAGGSHQGKRFEDLYVCFCLQKGLWPCPLGPDFTFDEVSIPLTSAGSITAVQLEAVSPAAAEVEERCNPSVLPSVAGKTGYGFIQVLRTELDNLEKAIRLL